MVRVTCQADFLMDFVLYTGMERLDGGMRWSGEMDKMCSSCARKGRQRKLQAFQLNFDEAVYMCSDAEVRFG
jgi:hypothetical protein